MTLPRPALLVIGLVLGALAGVGAGLLASAGRVAVAEETAALYAERAERTGARLDVCLAIASTSTSTNSTLVHRLGSIRSALEVLPSCF